LKTPKQIRSAHPLNHETFSEAVSIIYELYVGVQEGFCKISWPTLQRMKRFLIAVNLLEEETK
jgi:hypothetical protein